MGVRSAMKTNEEGQFLLDWISRKDGKEPFERRVSESMGLGYLAGSTLHSLRRAGVPMSWVGSAAQEMRLEGEVFPAAASRVLVHGIGPDGQRLRTNVKAENRKDPQTGEVVAQGRRHLVALVFTMPKTISLLLASKEKRVRDMALAALDQASEAAALSLEQNIKVRRGARGVRSEGVRGLIGVRALHFTSSLGDPHLHAHFLFNASAPALSDGKWLAIDGKVLFGCQRAAEAAFQRTLKRQLSRQMKFDWQQIRENGFRHWEIADLLPAVERFSKATVHMRQVALDLGIPIDAGPWNNRQDTLVWRGYREIRKEAAEKLEHALDEVIKQGGDGAEFLRAGWRQQLGREVALSLDRIKMRAQPLPAEDNKEEMARWLWRLDFSRQQQAQGALKAFQEKNRVYGEERIGEDALQRLEERLQEAKRANRVLGVFAAPDRQQVTRLEEEIATSRRYNELWDKANSSAADRRALEELRLLSQQLGSRGGRYCVCDLLAYWVGEGARDDAAYQLTAATLDLWEREGLVHLPQDIDRKTLLRAVREGGSTNTRLNQQVWGYSRIIVGDHLVKSEEKVREQASELCGMDQAPPLAIDVTSLTAEQVLAAACIARGKGLTTIEGPAGSGKTHLMKPVMAAAHRQGRDVVVLSRNAKLAHDLAEELGVEGFTLAAWKKAAASPPGRMVLLDEAGLVDQEDFRAVMEQALSWRQQVVAFGDLRQTQSIDGKATWKVVCEEAKLCRSYAELNESFRCKGWAKEAELFGKGDRGVVPLVVGDGRLLVGKDQAAKLVARVVLELNRRGEEALGVAATNEAAADIAEVIQRYKGIVVDARTLLRLELGTGLGDSVRARQTDRALGILNGNVFTVKAIDQKGLTLQAKGGRTVWVSHDWSGENLELAYASTVDSAQGMTTGRAVVLLDQQHMGRCRLNSAATRGRLPPFLVAPDAEDGIDAEAMLRRMLDDDDRAKTVAEILWGSREQEREWQRQRAQAFGLEQRQMVEEAVAQLHRHARMIEEGRLWNMSSRPLTKFLSIVGPALERGDFDRHPRRRKEIEQDVRLVEEGLRQLERDGPDR